MSSSRASSYPVEAAVVSVALTMGLDASEGLATAAPDLFDDPRHRVIMGELQRAAADGVTCDLILFASRLRDFGQLDAAGGLHYVSGLYGHEATANRVPEYLDILRRERSRRTLRVVAEGAAGSAANQATDPALIASALMRSVEPIALGGTTGPRLHPCSALKLAEMAIPARKPLLSPWLHERELAMIYGPRGVGKSWCSLGVAVAIAGGGKFAKWEAQEQRRVLLVDYEMPLDALQRRINILACSQGVRDNIADTLFVVSADLEGRIVPNLAQRDGQAQIDQAITDTQADVLILDNLSAGARGVDENDANEWEPVQAWLMDLRRRGVTVIIIHHAGKTGIQRGTSRREDALDVVIKVSRPQGYHPRDGAVFGITFEKARGIYGDDVEPFEVQVGSDENPGIHVLRSPVSLNAQIMGLHAKGTSIRDIAEETGCSRSKVQRIIDSVTKFPEDDARCGGDFD